MTATVSSLEAEFTVDTTLVHAAADLRRTLRSCPHAGVFKRDLLTIMTRFPMLPRPDPPFTMKLGTEAVEVLESEPEPEPGTARPRIQFQTL